MTAQQEIERIYAELDEDRQQQLALVAVELLEQQRRES